MDAKKIGAIRETALRPSGPVRRVNGPAERDPPTSFVLRRFGAKKADDADARPSAGE